MDKNFIQAENGEFILNNKKIALRGFGLGAWMNIEHFMIGIPGIEKRIRQTFVEVYGKENTAKFFDDFLNYFITEDDFVFLKSLGVNVLRFALNYRHFEDDQSPGKYKQEAFKHINRVLQLCKKYGIFVILDMHTAPGGQNPDWHADNDTGVAVFWEDASLRERLINLWGYIAEQYKDEPVIAGYDIVNEPCLVSDVDAFNGFFDKVIKRIRRTDNNHIIFVEGDDWGKDFSLFRKLGGEQQGLSFHLYPGQHVGMDEDSNIRKEKLEKMIKVFCELREKTGMPLWCGETGGGFPKDKIIEHRKLVKDCLDLFEKYHISWTLWAYKDAKAMSLVYPRDDTQWMAMAHDFRSKWVPKGGRQFVKEIFEILENKFSYSISEDVRYKLSFRFLALLNQLHVEQLVKPKLQSIPWEEIKEYPKSFLWENCDYWKEIAELVKSYTGV
jgi:endoglucanase